MQKREAAKQGGAPGGSGATPAPKRGRPFGSTSAAAAAAAAAVAAAADSPAPSTVLGPSLQLHSAFAGHLSQTLALVLFGVWSYNLSQYIKNKPIEVSLFDL